MNLRLENQCLRFRISKNELGVLYSGSNLIQQIFLPNRHMLSIDISTQEQKDELLLKFKKDSMSLLVKKEVACSLYKGLPSREGIEINQQIENNHLLKLILEVDIRTQKGTLA